MGGAWVDKSKVATGTRVKIVSEAEPRKEVFEGKEKIRNIVKLRIEGESDPKNFELNRPTINGLIDAFGEESKEWINKPLTAVTETVIVGGRRGKAMYLVPEGFKFGTDSNDFVVIERLGSHGSHDSSRADIIAESTEQTSDGYPDEDIKPEDIPW